MKLHILHDIPVEMDGSCLYSICKENGRRDDGWCVFGGVQLTLHPLECAGKACGVSQCRQTPFRPQGGYLFSYYGCQYNRTV